MMKSNLKNIPQPQISMEALFMKLALLDKSIDISQILSGGESLNIAIEKPEVPTKLPLEIKQPKENEKNTTIEIKVTFK